MFITDNIDFSAYLHATDHKYLVKDVSVWVDELSDNLDNPVVEKETLMQWESTKTFAFRPGEVTVWAGSNGGGKSLLTGQVALGLIKSGEKVCVQSFEMKPKVSIKRLIRQFAGENIDEVASRLGLDYKRALYNRFKAFAMGSLWFYDQQGTVTAEQVISVSRYCAVELGVTHIIIDSLMKCVRGEDDYNGQKAFVDEMTALARDHNVHIHLVHHIRKLQSDENMPNKNDLRGSSSITDQVDNVFIVWRNKKKENEINRGKEADMSEPDMILMNEKQRNGESTEWYHFWYDRASTQFLEKWQGLVSDFDNKGRFKG
jgi:twinkle protein